MSGSAESKQGMSKTYLKGAPFYNASASVYRWSSGDCTRFGLSDGQTDSSSGPEVGFWEICQS